MVFFSSFFLLLIPLSKSGFQDGVPHGKGQATFQNGTLFNGLFKNGSMEKGEMTIPDKNWAKGQTAETKGSVLSGKWKGDSLQKGSFSFHDGEWLVEGNSDSANRISIPEKGRCMPVTLPVTRPSFPLTLLCTKPPK